MDALLSLVPLVLILCMPAAFIKLAARLLRSIKVSWLHAFAYALIIVVLSAAVRASLTTASISLHPALGIPFGLIAQTAIGAWFFSTRATLSTGHAIGLLGGAKLSALAFLVSLLFLAVLWGTLSVVFLGAQP